ncbi:ABC transporter permease [Actinoplanes sp. HUAS TT8]|uniref:ABC transporter permease n=1 Tax=Actinoplanes sp. HUAS TT8 TaxID=3447453 RepID=UPI003F528BD6
MSGARRAVTRWAWRMFRREWRGQLLVLILLGLAVAATSAGLGVVSSFATGQAGRFGAADYRITLDAARPDLPGDLAALRASVGAVESVDRRLVSVPGSATPMEVRGQAAHGALSAPTLRLTGGRFPAGPGEAAVTARAARLFGLHPGGTWAETGHTWTIVGTVENPNDLLDTFALVAPGQAGPLTDVIVLIKATPAQFAAAARPDAGSVEVRSSGERGVATAAVLGLATVGLLFVGLLAVAGFTVLAQRRLRALGMLGAVGASPRHVRLVPIVNGAATGVVAALSGTVTGLGAWFLLAPALESVVEHRIDRFDLPWWAVGLTAGLAVLTAVVAAWWPARAVARVPIVAALASRPARPRPAHRFAVAGLVLLPAGLGLLAAAQREKAVFIVSLPAYTSGPSVLLTPKGMRALGVQAEPGAWLLEAPRALTPDQADQMRTVAGGAGLTVETRPAKADLSALRFWSVLAGVVVALGVLALTVGLIRSETGRDLRTLAAAGAPPRTRRTLTASTAAALAVVGALLGLIGAYTAMLALYHRDLHLLVPVPYAPLAGLLLGLPVLAVAAGWLSAGREPAGIARSPLD